MTTVRAYLDRAVALEPLADPVSPGYSGATLERLTLDDGSRVILKTAAPAFDLGMRATDDPGRAFLFLREGVYARLPRSVDPAILAVERLDGDWRMVMRDVSDLLLPAVRPITRAEIARVLRALVEMHAALDGFDSPIACPLETHLSLFAPWRMRRWADDPGGLPIGALHGWDAFADRVPVRVLDAIRSIHEAPQGLAAHLRAGGRTLLHGDVTAANLGLAPDGVILLDFALASSGPGEMDMAILLVQEDWRIDATPDALLDDWRAARDGLVDERTLRLALLGALAEYGCWKVPDDPPGAPGSAAFDWWVEVAERVIVEEGSAIGL